MFNRSNNESVSVLLVEDNDVDALLIERALSHEERETFVVEHASTLSEANKSLSTMQTDIVLLDLSLPDSSGQETFRQLHAMLPHLPIIVLTGLDDESMGAELVKEGAQDYVAKSEMEGRLLSRSIRYAIERKRVEEALRLAEEKYRTVVEHAADSIVVIVDGRIVFCNRVFAQVTGIAESELIDIDFRNLLLEPGELPFLLDSFQATGRDGLAVEHEIAIRNSSSESLVMEVKPCAFEYEGRRATLLIIRDVTERKRMEDQLLQSQKMEAIGTLAGGVAHDFNNMLSAILSYAHLATIEIEHGRPVNTHLDEIRKAGERSTDLTKQLLAFSRRQIFNPRVANLNVVISDLEKMLTRMIGEHIEIELILDYNLANILVDSSQIEQVIVNMAVNSRDAMPEGGKLVIRTYNTEVDASTVVSEPELSVGQYVTLKISDSGSGIEKDKQAHIFEPFYTSKEMGKGTGLGLSMCHGIIAQSGGHISVESIMGEGTSFTVYLPAVDEAADDSTNHNKDMSIPRGNESVLLVEDEPIVRRVATKILSDQGYVVEVATNGEEALQILTANSPSYFDLLITDVVMPVMGGRELVEKLRETQVSTSVLYMTGYTDDDIFRQDVLGHNCAVIQKPFTPNTLAQRVRDILDKP